MTDKLIYLTETLLAKAVAIGLVEQRDLIYFRNHYAQLFDYELTNNPIQINPKLAQLNLADIARQIYLALDGNQIANLGNTKEQIETRIIDELMPRPSTIESKFRQIEQTQGIEAALDWYYLLSQNTNYIKTADIARNQSWSTETEYGNLEITINLSKPEKDPLEIAKLKAQQKKNAGDYPQCLLCIENEGYTGDLNKPARQNHRMLQLNLDNNAWYFQYSPYLYYPEHSIVINQQHQDMQINQQALKNMFSFVEQIPHYLIGSNSDIPIVGGSILNHDHYQAGNYVFPLEKTSVRFSHSLAQFNNVILNYLNWPLSTLQLIGNKSDLLQLAELVIQKWYTYNNSELGIISAFEQGVRHNAITPILRKSPANDDSYSLYLILRNNRTSDEHPEGIFHPHRELHHIKKENIGLIEAMGLAILPGRLAAELKEIENLLLLNDVDSAVTSLLFDETLVKHEEWLKALYMKYPLFSANNVQQILQIEVGLKFSQVLENCGVFKLSPTGDKGLKEFLSILDS